jgi:hypothetical protein
MRTIQNRAAVKKSKLPTAKKARAQTKTKKTSYTDAELAQMPTKELALLAYGMTYKRVHSKRKAR